jgi:chitinase
MAATKLRAATPYGVKAGNENFVAPADTLDVVVDLVGFKHNGDDNYPLAIGVKIKNNSDVDITGAKLSFDVSSAVPLVPSAVEFMKPGDPVSNINGVENLVAPEVRFGSWTAVTAGSKVGNVGGLPNEFHRFSFQFTKPDPKAWNGIGEAVTMLKPGNVATIGLRVFMPMSTPSNVTLTLPNGKVYGIKQ